MKKHILLISFLVLTSVAFGQQFLWSTVKPDSTSDRKYVPLSSAHSEVGKYYDLYPYYFDLTGYSKQRFIDEVGFGFEEWDWLKSVDSMTVYSAKSNTGRGSVIMVLCVSKDYMDVVLFSNDITAYSNPQSTTSYDRPKFIKWFKSLLSLN